MCVYVFVRVCACVVVQYQAEDFKEKWRPLKVSGCRRHFSDADFYLVFIDSVNSILYSCHKCFSDLD